MSNPQEVRILSPGTNWLKVGGMLALGLTGYYSPLPEGTFVSLSSAHTGKMCIQGPVLVDGGRFDMGITTPPWMVKAMNEGKVLVDHPLKLSGMGVFPHEDQFVMAVRKDTGITSIRQIVEEKVPLRIGTAPVGLNHCAGWLLDCILQEYGTSREEMVAWGAEFVDNNRQPNYKEGIPQGRLDRISAVQQGVLNAVFDEAIMTKPWEIITDTVEMTFLPIDEDVMVALGRKYGAKRGLIPKGRLKGVDRDILAVDFSGWLLFCRDDLPDELVYLTLKGLDEQKKQLEGLFDPYQGLTGSIDLRELWKGTEIPLHPGAERYYKEHGYM